MFDQRGLLRKSDQRRSACHFLGFCSFPFEWPCGSARLAFALPFLINFLLTGACLQFALFALVLFPTLVLIVSGFVSATVVVLAWLNAVIH